MAGKTENKSRVLLELACPPAWKTAGDVTEWAVVLHVHESINEDFSWHENFYLPSPSWTLWLTEIRDQLPLGTTPHWLSLLHWSLSLLEDAVKSLCGSFW